MKKAFPFCLMVLFLLFFGCGEKEKPPSSPVQRPLITGITLLQISPSSIDAFYETSGTVKAGTTSIISSRSMGTVTAVKFKEGDRVKAGQVLLTIDDHDLVQKVAEAEAANQEASKALEAAVQNKSLAEVTYDRYKNLHREKVITQQEMDQIETQKKVAQAEVDRLKETVKRATASLEWARIYRGYARVQAPVSGVVTEKKIDPGSLAVPGMPLLTIEDTSRFKVEAYIDEQLIQRFKAGTRADVLFEGTRERIPGFIAEVVPAVDPATRTYLIKIPLQGPALRSGLYCRILIFEGKKETLLIPKKAVVERGQLTGVYVVDEKGVMTLRLIRIGKEYADRTEVLSGLKGGERIVVEGVERAVDGGMVKL